MGKFVLVNARVFTGGADLTGMSNKVELYAEVETKDVTTFGSYDAATSSLWQENLGGLRKSMWSGEGLWEAGDAGKVDNESWASLGAVKAYTACPHTADVSALAWLTKMLRSSYTLGDQVGEVAPWSAKGHGAWPLVRGTVAHPPGTARTATGSGTAIQLGAVAADKYQYATLHVLSVSGTDTPTLTVKIQSDDNSGFTTATDRITFSGATAIGDQVDRVAGAVTDDYWRAQWTISGTNPSFLFLVGLGIAA